MPPEDGGCHRRSGSEEVRRVVAEFEQPDIQLADLVGATAGAGGGVGRSGGAGDDSGRWDYQDIARREEMTHGYAAGGVNTGCGKNHIPG